jgi:hypothetical protein
MPNVEFIARNGIVSRGNLVVSGSVISTSPASFSGSLSVTGSLQVSSSANSFFVGGGSVGVGTTSPSYPLDVSGNTRFQGTGLFTSGANNQISVIANADSLTPYINFQNSGVGTSRLNAFTATSGNLINSSGMSITTTSTSSFLSLKANDIVAASNIESLGGRYYLSSATGNNGILFLHPGVSYRGLIGFDASSTYFQIRTGYTTDFSAGNLNAAFFDSGNSAFGSSTDMSARLGVKGSGTTSSTTAFLVQNANATNMLSLTDNGALTINTFQTSSTAFTINRTDSSMGGSFNLATMGRLLNINDTVGNSNIGKTTVYINTTGASTNNALIVENGAVGFGTTAPGGGFTSALFTTLSAGLRVNLAGTYQITSRDTRQIFNTTHGGGISFWGGSAGQGEGTSAYAGIRGLKANSTYVNSLGNLVFYVQTGSSHEVTETTFREVARFNDLGYFGIGTSTPSASLHISGSSNSTLFEIDSPTANNIIFVSGSGNVGIGTSTPTSRLSVAGNINLGSNSIGNIGSNQYMQSQGGGTGEYRFVNGAGGGWFYTWCQNSGDGLTERMRLSTSNNLLIGTTSDSARLTAQGVGSTTSSKTFLLQNSNATQLGYVDDSGQWQIGSGTNGGYKLDVNGSQRILGNLTITAGGSGTNTFNANVNYLFANSNNVYGIVDLQNPAGQGVFLKVTGTPIAGTSFNYFLIQGTTTSSTVGTTRNVFNVNPTYNLTDTFTGTMRGFYYNPVLTSMTGAVHRAIETTSGDVVFNGGRVTISGSAGSGSALYAYKSGSTVLDIQGSQGQLFSVIDALSGSLMSVNDISGLPIVEVFSDDRVVMGTYGAPAVIVTGSVLNVTGSLVTQGQILDPAFIWFMS